MGIGMEKESKPQECTLKEELDPLEERFINYLKELNPWISEFFGDYCRFKENDEERK